MVRSLVLVGALNGSISCLVEIACMQGGDLPGSAACVLLYTVVFCAR